MSDARDELAKVIRESTKRSLFGERHAGVPEMADAILAAGYSKPRTISAAAELEAVRFGSAVQTSDESDTVVLRGSGRHFVNQSGAEVDVETLWRYGTHPFTVIFEPQP